MSKKQELVQAFHHLFNHPVYTEWNEDSFHATFALRRGLIEEEFAELTQAIEKKDKVEVLDALADLLYVTYGAGLSFGLPLEDFSFPFPKEEKTVKEEGIWWNLCQISHAKLQTSVEDALEAMEYNDGEEEIQFYLQALANQIHVMAYMIEMDIERAFTEVHESNMTKACATEQEAVDTVAQYTRDSRDTVYEKKGTYWIVLDAKTKKALKNIYYKKVNLSWCLLD